MFHNTTSLTFYVLISFLIFTSTRARSRWNAAGMHPGYDCTIIVLPILLSESPKETHKATGRTRKTPRHRSSGWNQRPWRRKGATLPFALPYRWEDKKLNTIFFQILLLLLLQIVILTILITSKRRRKKEALIINYYWWLG